MRFLAGGLFVSTLVMLWFVASHWPYADSRTDRNDKHFLTEADRLHCLALGWLMFVVTCMTTRMMQPDTDSSSAGDNLALGSGPASRVILTMMCLIAAFGPIIASLICLQTEPSSSSSSASSSGDREDSFDLVVDNPMNRKSVIGAKNATVGAIFM